MLIQKDMKFLLIIFKRVVRMPASGLDRGATGTPMHHFRIGRQIFQVLTLPKNNIPRKAIP